MPAPLSVLFVNSPQNDTRSCRGGRGAFIPHEPSRYMRTQLPPDPRFSASCPHAPPHARTPSFPLHRPGICLHCPEPGPSETKVPVSTLPPPPTPPCWGNGVTCCLQGTQLGGTADCGGIMGAKTVLPSSYSSPWWGRGSDPIGADLDSLSVGEGTGFSARDSGGWECGRATPGAELERIDLVGAVDFWGPSWGLGKRAGFWGAEGICGCGARWEVGGLRPRPLLACIPCTRSWGWGWG